MQMLNMSDQSIRPHEESVTICPQNSSLAQNPKKKQNPDGKWIIQISQNEFVLGQIVWLPSRGLIMVSFLV